MKLSCIKTVLCLLSLCVFSSASLRLTVTSGEVLIKKQTDSSWNVIAFSTGLKAGDSLLVLDISSASCTINDSIQLLMKDSCILTFVERNDTIITNFIKGQLFLKKFSTHIPIIVCAKTCSFIPLGTVAAFKYSRRGDPSVAVLQGAIQMQAGSQNQIINPGMYCTYDINSETFSSVAKLPETALTALEAWSQTKLDENQTINQHSIKQPPSVDGVPQPSPLESTQQLQPSLTPQTAQSQQPNLPSDESLEPTKKHANDKPTWDIFAGAASIDDKQWTRIAVGVDVPIWKFGICFDFELFLNPQGELTSKGWKFGSTDDAVQSLSRKIRYVRYNQVTDPVFFKIGGLDDITLGYGFLVDRFTNMLSYPGEKLLGIQANLNSIGPENVSVQTVIADIMELDDEAGIIAARIALKPLFALQLPILRDISIAASAATDQNQYYPAKSWDYSLKGPLWDKNDNGITDSAYLFDKYKSTTFYDSLVRWHKAHNDYDTKVNHSLLWAKTARDRILLFGGDFSIPLITTQLLNLSVYSQAGCTYDGSKRNGTFYKGWGIGAPGIACSTGPFWAQLEYRHIADLFSPNYFNTYYMQDRVIKKTQNKNGKTQDVIITKEQVLTPMVLDGIYGKIGCNFYDLFTITGDYQYLVSPKNSNYTQEKDQRFQSSAALGKALIERIPRPKFSKIEAFYNQTHINNTLFNKSPNTNWGYRVCIQAIPNTLIQWETRYGWVEENAVLKIKKNISIAAGLTF